MTTSFFLTQSRQSLPDRELASELVRAAASDPKAPEYAITRVDVCFPCKDALGDWVKDRIKG